MKLPIVENIWTYLNAFKGFNMKNYLDELMAISFTIIFVTLSVCAAFLLVQFC